MTERILVAVDLEDQDLMVRMLRIAGEIAGLHDGQITLVHIATMLPPDVAIHMPKDYEDRLIGNVQDRLAQLEGQAGLSPGAVKLRVRIGTVYQEILDQAEDDGTDLIIIGCHSPDMTDYLLGSNAARVVRRSNCSVYVVRRPRAS